MLCKLSTTKLGVPACPQPPAKLAGKPRNGNSFRRIACNGHHWQYNTGGTCPTCLSMVWCVISARCDNRHPNHNSRGTVQSPKAPPDKVCFQMPACWHSYGGPAAPATKTACTGTWYPASADNAVHTRHLTTRRGTGYVVLKSRFDGIARIKVPGQKQGHSQVCGAPT